MNAGPKNAANDLLARAFLDILCRESGANSKPMLRSGDPDDPIERLLDDLSVGHETAARITIRPDLAAAAVLTARAIETVPSLVRDLRRSAPVVTITTHTPDLVSLAKDVIKQCAFSSGTKVLDLSKYQSGYYDRAALVIERDGSGNDHKPEKGNDVVADALHAHSPIIGIAPDPARHLPRDLLRAAEQRLILPHLDSVALSLIIEAVTGQRPSVDIDAGVIRAADISDLQLALRSDRSPDECIRKLDEIIKNKGMFNGSGPCLEELAGYGTAKIWGLELAEDLRSYRQGLLDWSSIEKGLLLAGAPGVGKTQFARALAKTAGVPLIATSVADWNASTYLSGTLQAIKNSFAQARKMAPCILFIDELDGISDRANLREYAEYWSQLVNLLLELLAGIDERPGVVVIGATNHPDRIDAAIRRAGRLDRTITIEKPGFEDLREIFRFHLNGVDIGDLTSAALAARGGTGADVEAWCRRAKSSARRQNRELTIDDLLEEIRSGRDELPQSLRRVCAIHEAGHIVAGAALAVATIQAVSIHDTGGATKFEMNREKHQTLVGIENLICALLAGRAAEEILLPRGETTAGAGVGERSDFAIATDLAIEIETKLGFGELGLIYLPDRVTDTIVHHPPLIELVRSRLDRCYRRTLQLVSVNTAAVTAIAVALETRGFLDKADIEKLLATNPLQTDAPALAPISADLQPADR